MSYVDTQPHEYCGMLGNLPLYHPQAFYKDELEFIAGPQNLLLGGGSGEHPAAVFNPIACALGTLSDIVIQMLEVEDMEDEEEQDIQRMFHSQAGLVMEDVSDLECTMETLAGGYFNCGDFSSWSGMDWYRFVKEASHSGHRPYKIDSPEGTSIERWVSDSIGEYVWVARPAMLYSRSELMMHTNTIKVVSAYLARYPIHANVLQLPVGYNCWGRGKSLNDPNMAH